jgi:hypothetical protein
MCIHPGAYLPRPLPRVAPLPPRPAPRPALLLPVVVVGGFAAIARWLAVTGAVPLCA